MKKAPSAIMILGIVFTLMGMVFMIMGGSIGLSDTDNGSLLFLYIFGGVGLLFFVIGLPFLIAAINKRKMITRLIETGEQAVGVIQNMVINRQVTVNGRHPFRAECQVTDPVTGEIYLYSSENIMKKADYLIGRSVTVYYDPDDRSKYYVDIDSAERDYGTDAPEVHDFR